MTSDSLTPDRGSAQGDGLDLGWREPDGTTLPKDTASHPLPSRSQPPVDYVPCACGGLAPCDVDQYVLHVGSLRHLTWRGRQDGGPTYLPEFAGRHDGEREPMG